MRPMTVASWCLQLFPGHALQPEQTMWKRGLLWLCDPRIELALGEDRGYRLPLGSLSYRNLVTKHPS